MGTGHVMRMIALGQAWRDKGGDVIFLCAEVTPPLADRLKLEGFSLQRVDVVPGSIADLEVTCASITRHGDDLVFVVLDGYQFDADFQVGLKSAGCRLLVIDDYGHASSYRADLVLNQNISARANLYAASAQHCEFLLGTKFALLRKEFLAYQSWRRKIVPVAKNILITLGGSDPDNVTLKVIKELIDFDLHAKVVIGGSNPHLREIEDFIRSQSDSKASIELVVNPTNMPELMAWADLALSAAGSTLLELAHMGLPTLLVVMADNQKVAAEEAGRLGMAKILGEGNMLDTLNICEEVRDLCLDKKKRGFFSKAGKSHVDGKGVKRVLCHLMTGLVRLRDATENDLNELWRWRRDAVTRNLFLENKQPSLLAHKSWFRRAVKNPECVLLIAENQKGESLGQIRFDVVNKSATIHITIAPEFQGRGWGPAVIRKASEILISNRRAETITANVKSTNIPSRSAFELAGYKKPSNAHEEESNLINYYLSFNDLRQLNTLA